MATSDAFITLQQEQVGLPVPGLSHNLIALRKGTDTNTGCTHHSWQL